MIRRKKKEAKEEKSKKSHSYQHRMEWTVGLRENILTCIGNHMISSAIWNK